MSTSSISNNPSALIALSTLEQVTAQLQTTQSHISTGLQIANPQDNPAVWTVTQGQSAAVTALDSVTTSLNRAQSVLDVAISAGQTISDLLQKIHSDVVSASDPSLETTARLALNVDVQSLISQIKLTVDQASFNGISLIQTGATGFATLADPTANASTVTVQPVSLAVGGPNISFTLGSSFTTVSQAVALLTLVNASVQSVNSAVGGLGVQSNTLSAHLTLVSTFQDTLISGVGDQVDANLGNESAALSALQLKQQLSTQTLSIANSTSSVLLGLFK